MKKTLLAIMAAVLLVGLSACSSYSTDADETVVQTHGGPMQSKTISEDCKPASNKGYDSIGDKHAYYPIGQRTFGFSNNKDAETGPIKTKTKGGNVELSTPGFITFHLKTDCETLRKFHEKVGRKYHVYGDDSGAFSGGNLPAGYVKFLENYLGIPLNSAMDKAGQAFDWKTLSFSTDAQTAFEEDVKASLPGQLDPEVRDFIVIDNVTIQTPEPPAELKAALQQVEEAKAQDDAQEQRNAVAATKYKQIEECKKYATEKSCILLKLAEDGKLPFLPIGPDGNFIVNPPAK